MKIQYSPEKIKNFSDVVFAQNFNQYSGMTHTFKNFEDQNLTKLIKTSVLKKLSVTNHLNVPSFEDFWEWIRKKHGTELSIMLVKFIAPKDDKLFNYLKNVMRNQRNNDLWMHIKARIYKKWCSIVTEMQCVYSLTEGINSLQKKWEIIVSPNLDAVGIDFVIVKENNEIYPFQIKKDSFNPYAQKKYNSKENFDKVELKKRALKELMTELDNNKIIGNIHDLIILKYGVTSNEEMPYSYLRKANNGFVYYDAKLLTEEIDNHLN